MNRIIPLLLALVSSQSAFAGSDSCEDVGMRIYRADLAPYSLKIHAVETGDLGNYQSAELTLKNVGTIKLGPSQAPGGGFNVAPIKVKLGGFTVNGWASLPVAAGATTKVFLRLPEGYVHNCQTLAVGIDLVRSVGQHGCDCYKNDSKIFSRVQIVDEPSCREP